MVEAELSLFEVQIKHVSGHAVEAGQAVFGVAPEALDAVDVATSIDELIVAVVDPQVLA